MGITEDRHPFPEKCPHCNSKLEEYRHVAEIGLDNHKEASDLTEAVKQTLYEEYLQAYSESNR
jgi:hypothetical protein